MDAAVERLLRELVDATRAVAQELAVNHRHAHGACPWYVAEGMRQRTASGYDEQAAAIGRAEGFYDPGEGTGRSEQGGEAHAGRSGSRFPGGERPVTDAVSEYHDPDVRWGGTK